MLSLNTVTIWMIFMMTLKITTTKKEKVLFIFDDMISHLMSNKKAQRELKELFIRCRKLNISLCF